MSRLYIFQDDSPEQSLIEAEELEGIAQHLQQEGVRFERWDASHPVIAGATQEAVLAAYDTDIQRLIAEDGYQTVDVVSLTSDHPDKATMREKFLAEHSHNEDEVRFFVDGEGLFSLHINNKVYEVLCKKGDLISVPANTPHWFDMGPNPNFVAIRLFNNPEGWVAQYTGSDIASRFSRLEN